MTAVLAFPFPRQHVQHEGTRVCHLVTTRQRDNVYAVLGAWWCADGVTLISHDAALRLALLLSRRP